MNTVVQHAELDVGTRRQSETGLVRVITDTASYLPTPLLQLM